MREVHPFDKRRGEESLKVKIVINEMPDKETLQEFIRGMSGNPKVLFDKEQGKFIWTGQKQNSKDSSER